MKSQSDSITVVIQAHNEEKHMADCIDSAKLLTDSVLVTDIASTDNTKKIAEKNAKVVTVPFSRYVEPIRNMAFQQTENEWIFLLDADERITKELAHEIKTKIEKEHFSYYRIPRKNIFAEKKWLQYGGWSPDFQLRLIKKSDFVNWPSRIHSTPEITGEGGNLEHPILHYFHPNLTQMVEKTVIFEDIESDLLYKAGRKVTVGIFFRKFFGELNRRLIIKQGYKDGTFGIIESFYQAFSKTITYLFLYEKYKKNRSV